MSGGRLEIYKTVSSHQKSQVLEQHSNWSRRGENLISFKAKLDEIMRRMI